MRHALVAAVAVLLAGAPAALASPPRLTVKQARVSILTYERAYWQRQHRTVSVSIPGCHREGPRRISCVAEVATPGSVLRVRDWATRISPAVIRVHPGSSYEEVKALQG